MTESASVTEADLLTVTSLDDLDVRDDEFVCTECWLALHQCQESDISSVCKECAHYVKAGL